MTYKAAISNLDLGGGKGVIIKPEKDFDRKEEKTETYLKVKKRQ